MLTRLINLFELCAIIGILAIALLLQFYFHELPCPLCLLQRVGFFMITVGFLLNLKFGYRPFHYTIVLLSALFTAFVALRQIALHVIPGTGAYGAPILGLHLYTWSFIVSMAIIILTAVILGSGKQYDIRQYQSRAWRLITHLLFAFVGLILVANIVAVVFECGFHICPDNPAQYELRV